MQSVLHEKIIAVQGKIVAACKKAGRNFDEVKILAATKTVESARINTLKKVGINIIAENRVQELLSKYDAVKGFEWHFIGALQTNKVKYIIDKVSIIHSCDRVSLVDEIQKQAQKIDKIQEVLIQINAGDEMAKSGVEFSGVDELYNYITTKPNVKVVGFMPVMPMYASESLYEKSNEVFKIYKTKDSNVKMLSMGMSGDFELAIKHGATIVRLGSILLGNRACLD